MVRIFAEASGVLLRVRALPDSPWFLQLATLFLRFVLGKTFAGGMNGGSIWLGQMILGCSYEPKVGRHF